ncbi:MAG: hypothetical protein IKG81_11885 [Bacteroidales bacterium]|nr:hypothetical protein [Bacteroidales bacterium]
MKKAIILGTLICAIGMLTACKSGTANDTANNQTNTNELTWEAIDEKLAAGTLPNEAECLFILSDTTLDDGQSEGIGNHLFNFLCGYPKSNKSFTNAQKNFSSEEGDLKLINLMDLMSIDIALAEYKNYEEFLGDFPMYRTCKGAEENFKRIINDMR